MATRARDIVLAAGIFPRRLLRRMKCWVYLADGTKIGMDDPVALDGTPTSVHVRGRDLTAWHALPPVVALNKPAGFEVSHAPTAHPSAISLVPLSCAPAPELAVGRLDVETEGLLLTTSDGALVHRLTHPRHGVRRTYLVGTDLALSPEATEAIRAHEVVLRDGHRPEVAMIEPFDTTEWPPAFGAPPGQLAWTTVTLTSGRYHEVRRIFAAVGTPVVRLIRVAYGSVSLWDSPQLEQGSVRSLSDDEAAALYVSCGMSAPAPMLRVAWEAGTGDPS